MKKINSKKLTLKRLAVKEVGEATGGTLATQAGSECLAPPATFYCESLPPNCRGARVTVGGCAS